MANLANLYLPMKRYDDARAMFERILPTMRRVLRMGHPWTHFAMDGLAKAYINLDRREDALPLYRELLDLELATADDPDAAANTLNEAAWTLLTHDFEELNDPEFALGLAKRACSKEEAVRGANLWMYLDTLALAQHETGDTAKAIETQKRAVELNPDNAELVESLHRYEAALADVSDDTGGEDGQ